MLILTRPHWQQTEEQHWQKPRPSSVNRTLYQLDNESRTASEESFTRSRQRTADGKQCQLGRKLSAHSTNQLSLNTLYCLNKASLIALVGWGRLNEQLLAAHTSHSRRASDYRMMKVHGIIIKYSFFRKHTVVVNWSVRAPFISRAEAGRVTNWSVATNWLWYD